ncbi:hypothetical protein OU798_12890 [Prolixibacteraceae bacterium Z1-6]|uniref:Uncharacterized protein n=1 Tax=Draconibacterium aestuarii TaxID=2998507 RepID=A0A9X3F7N1_9BACT|nr:hypothetical protein [Prolixibacteraceae bacterium Z1-6]
MTKQNSLFEKYYKGETSLEEEQELRELVRGSDEKSAEKDVFDYFDNEAFLPEGLEEDLLSVVVEIQKQKKSIRIRLYSAISAAAVILIVLAVFLDARKTKKTQMADNFFVMEQALFQVSESLQPPQEPEEMLVLWVDDEVEIIIN